MCGQHTNVSGHIKLSLLEFNMVQSVIPDAGNIFGAQFRLLQAPSKHSDEPIWRPSFDHRTGATPSVMRTNLHAIPR